MLSDYQDCREDFSIVDGASPSQSANSSPRQTLIGTPVPTVTKPDGTTQELSTSGQIYGAAVASNGNLRVEDGLPAGTSDASEEPSTAPKKGVVVGCLSILDNIRSTGPSAAMEGQQQSRSKRLSGKPDAGSTMKKRDMSTSALDVHEAWEECEGQGFFIRSLEYAKTKQKVAGAQSIYQLVAVDMFSFPTKTTHVAKLVNLPTPPPQKHLHGLDAHIPPLLIINVMLPTYPASFFGANDGQGHSMIYYFALPEDFDPSKFENENALGLLRRFMQNGREADGANTRDRLKLIPRVVNVDEWAAKGPLSQGEYKLLTNYNDKPILTRPQQYFFSGHNYMEIDIDIHAYAFLARKALTSFVTRLGSTVFENAFVIQGNSPEELPEVVMACARLFRIDFTRMRPFSDFAPIQDPPALVHEDPASGRGHSLPSVKAL